jgi:hypothetical protein
MTIKCLQARCWPTDPTPLRPVHETNAYVPSLAERLDLDPNLNNGARRCARILAAYTHRRSRESLSAQITVTWIAKRMGVCRRTAQRYLRQLEQAGYIAVTVCANRARMCVGIIVDLLSPLLPVHGWPQTLGKPAATKSSQNYRFRNKYRQISRELWAWNVQEGLFRSLMNKLPPAPALL